MGSSMSSGQDNRELVDHLVDNNYIRSKKLEQVFRAVDRGDYFLSTHRQHAYRDVAWKHGNIHLSAPCIYCKVMEGLVLEPGLSFLNIGSGTGYLSTMAGLLLGKNGINHGIEFYDDCVKYAIDRLEEFKQYSLALDQFDFCEPKFVIGNCLNTVAPGRRYDRVYCGATCSETYESTIKEFVKVGGILVMPYRDNLLKLTRISEGKWVQCKMLPVSFANLIKPDSKQKSCLLPDCNPPALQELCRSHIRTALRKNIWQEYGKTLESEKPIILEKSKEKDGRSFHPFVFPVLAESDAGSSDEDDEDRGARFTINLESPEGENILSTLQFVRSIIQTNRNNRAQNEANHDSMSSEESEEILSETEDTVNDRVSSSSMSSPDSARAEESNPRTWTTRKVINYSSVAYSDSEEDDDSMEPCRKVLRKDHADSGIVEDHNSSFSSDSNQVASETAAANSTVAATPPQDDHRNENLESKKCPKDEDVEEAEGKKAETARTSKIVDNVAESKIEDSKVEEPVENAIYGHYVDEKAMSQHMKEKILLLPIPYALKLFVNYNRAL